MYKCHNASYYSFLKTINLTILQNNTISFILLLLGFNILYLSVLCRNKESLCILIMTTPNNIKGNE